MLEGVTGRQVIKKLMTSGWHVLRQKGSHVRMTDGKRFTTVPLTGGRDLPQGTLRAIARQTGVDL